MPGDKKESVFQKNQMGGYMEPMMNSSKISFLDIFKTKTALWIYGEYAKR
jgi:hypothetical protein